MNTLRAISKQFNVPLVSSIVIDKQNTNDVLNVIKNMSGIEGFVFRFDNGEMFKAKCDEYVSLHKAVSYLSSEKDIVRIILKNESDDLKATLSEEKRIQLEKFENAFIKNIEQTAERLWWQVCAWKDNNGDSQKKFAVEFINNKNNNINQNEKSILFSIFNKNLTIEQTVEFMIEYIKNYCSCASRLESVRNLFGNIRWNIDATE